MPHPNKICALPNRAVIAITGPDWAGFLKGLCTAHIELLKDEVGQSQFHRLHYGAFLRPQGKLICDVLLHAVGVDDIRLDVPWVMRDELLSKLNMYRLRARVSIAALDVPVSVSFAGDLPDDFMADPRQSIIDSKFGFAYSPREATAYEHEWRQFRYQNGLSDPGVDFAADALYAIDANLDLLNAIDFHKGCYVGQELTSRMKRRGQIKNRILPFRYTGAPPQAGAEVLNGDKRAGEVLAAADGYGLALMRIDRREGDLTSQQTALKLIIPDWLATALPAIAVE